MISGAAQLLRGRRLINGESFNGEIAAHTGVGRTRAAASVKIHIRRGLFSGAPVTASSAQGGYRMQGV
jgi:hypothetical protein